MVETTYSGGGLRERKSVAYDLDSARQKPSPNAGLQSASPSQRSEREEFQDIFSELMTGTEHEIAFLTRHYSETLGPWYVCHLVPDQYLLT